jgi:hypothetical protein
MLACKQLQDNMQHPPTYPITTCVLICCVYLLPLRLPNVPASPPGGFDGRGGWVQSKLLVKPTASMFSGVPSSPLPASLARTLSTRTESTRGRRALPAPSK